MGVEWWDTYRCKEQPELLDSVRAQMQAAAPAVVTSLPANGAVTTSGTRVAGWSPPNLIE